MTDSEMMISPMDWPRWPFLPLKHRTLSAHDPGFLGFMLAVATPPFVVYLDTFYKLKPDAKTLVGDWRVD